FDAFRAQLEELLSQEERPTGIICRSERLVSVVAAKISAAGLTSPTDVDIVFQTQATRASALLPYAHVRPKEPFKHIAEKVALILKRLRSSGPPPREQITIPVELHEPGESEIGD